MSWNVFCIEYKTLWRSKRQSFKSTLEEHYHQLVSRGWNDKTKCSAKEHEEYLKISARWANYRKRKNKPEERLAKLERALKNGQFKDDEVLSSARNRIAFARALDSFINNIHPISFVIVDGCI
jgi:hypothetical protein